MTACVYPGCVSLVANEGDTCHVHAGGEGKPCAYCRGNGWLWRTNDTTRKAEQTSCDRCAGVGRVDAKKRIVRVRPEDDPIDQRPLIQLADEDDSLTPRSPTTGAA